MICGGVFVLVVLHNLFTDAYVFDDEVARSVAEIKAYTPIAVCFFAHNKGTFVIRKFIRQ